MNALLITALLLTPLPAGVPGSAGRPTADTVTVSGTVAYADGSPAADCRVLVLHPGFEPLARTRCDDDGRYRLRLAPGSYNGIAILDDGYGETTLEFWAWNVDASRDLTVDALIDRLEVYNLAVWNSKGGSQSFFVSFRPMSLDRVAEGGQEPELRHVPGRGQVAVIDLAPDLGPDDVEVLVDGEPTAVEMLQWYYHRIPGDDGDTYMPVALVQAVRPPLDPGPHAVRVRVTDGATGSTGQAVTWFTSNEKGFGF